MFIAHLKKPNILSYTYMGLESLGSLKSFWKTMHYEALPPFRGEGHYFAFTLHPVDTTLVACKALPGKVPS
jgi:hypothetical protein